MLLLVLRPLVSAEPKWFLPPARFTGRLFLAAREARCAARGSDSFVKPTTHMWLNFARDILKDGRKLTVGRLNLIERAGR